MVAQAHAAKPLKRSTLAPGTLIVNERRRYVTETLLGRGGMGDVYKVHLQNDKSKFFALKTEDRNAPEAAARLKVETNVYDAIREAPDTVDKTHFLQMHGMGKTPNIKFMIMDIAGDSLQDIIVRMLHRKVSLHTTISIAQQTLKAIRALHDVGWLHRDIKTANFVIGLPPRDSIIYMMDFGTARRYIEEDSKLLRFPRPYVETACTVRYCSLRCHDALEQGRRDDLEVWMYMMLEIFDERNLPWMRSDHVNQVRKMKRKLLKYPTELFEEKKLHVPSNFVPIIQSISRMVFTDAGDFSLLFRQLDSIVAEKKVNMNLPLDWIGKKMPPRKPLPPTEDEILAANIKKQHEIEDELMKLCDEVDKPKSLSEIREHIYDKLDGLTGDLITMMTTMNTTQMNEKERAKVNKEIRKMRLRLVEEFERAGEKKTEAEIEEIVNRKMEQRMREKEKRERKERKEKRREEATEGDDERSKDEKKRRRKRGTTVDAKTRDESDRDRRRASGARKGKDGDERKGDRKKDEADKKKEVPKEKAAAREEQKSPSKMDAPEAKKP